MAEYLWVAIPKEKASDVLNRLKGRNFDSRREIFTENGMVYIPVFEPVYGYSIYDSKEPRWRAIRKKPYERILDEAEVPEELKRKIPDGWERMGDAVIISIPPELKKYEKEVARAFTSVLGVSRVFLREGVIEGEFRRPNVRLLYGRGTDVRFVENGILYTLDPTRIMFSAGNRYERERMGKIKADGETVVDMFAGIGYFTLPMAKYSGAERVIACEKNPEAYRYLLKNIEINKLNDKIMPVAGDNRLLPENVADRVIMGYIDTGKFLGKAVRILKEEGIIHYHDVVHKSMLDTVTDNIMERLRGADTDILKRRIVKHYGPNRLHFVIDIKIKKVGRWLA